LHTDAKTESDPMTIECWINLLEANPQLSQ